MPIETWSSSSSPSSSSTSFPSSRTSMHSVSVPLAACASSRTMYTCMPTSSSAYRISSSTSSSSSSVGSSKSRGLNAASTSSAAPRKASASSRVEHPSICMIHAVACFEVGACFAFTIVMSLRSWVVGSPSGRVMASVVPGWNRSSGKSVDATMRTSPLMPCAPVTYPTSTNALKDSTCEALWSDDDVRLLAKTRLPIRRDMRCAPV
mmetsp:Transcript_2841/g.7751  ORF Transcript_2841/g.7751 Transcript_2841/m.7751 type:complete len:207 (-) Transcript_2841:103-723(-)